MYPASDTCMDLDPGPILGKVVSARTPSELRPFVPLFRITDAVRWSPTSFQHTQTVYLSLCAIRLKCQD